MITVGSLVRIRSGGERGTVLELKDGFAKVLTTSGEEWHPLEELEEELSLIEKVIRGEFDDGLDFILAVDAYRLLSEYKFNPYVLACSTKITIYPHQVDEVVKILDNPRMMLADEVGLGKTIAAGLVASELRARGLVKRMLFVVPKSLVYKWRDELNGRFDMGAEILNSEYVKVHGNPLVRNEFCFISSIDYLKQDHVLRMINIDDVKLDLVVVDEAHKMSIGTDRFKLGRVLAQKADNMLMLTATPHRGDDEDYLARMRLLDPYVTDVKSASHLLIRNMKDDVIDLDGKKVFPERSSETVPVKLTPQELSLHKRIDEYVSRRLSEARDRREQSAIRFVGLIIRKRASSSLRALRLTLERRLAKLGQAFEVEQAIKAMREAEEEFDEKQYEEIEQRIIGLSFGRLEEERRELEELLREVRKLEQQDSKFSFLLKTLEKIKSGDRSAKVVIFSEYRDTVNYLYERLRKKYRVTRIDGLMNIDERYQALEEFRDPDGAELMVCTDAAGEGIDMQFCNIMINYDIPWNPNRLEQRMGRIHRIGQTRPVHYYNFVLEETIDGYILKKILDKLEAIKRAMGDRAYDVIGRLLSEDDIPQLYEELIRAPKEVWTAKIVRIENLMEERRRILEKVNSLLVGHKLDKSKLDEFKKVRLEAVDKGEVKRFVEVYLKHNGGDMKPVDESKEIYRIVMPRRLAFKVKMPIITGTFSSTIAQQKGYPYLALGNSHVMSMILDAMRPSASVFKHPEMEGVLYVYRFVLKDRKGYERDGRVIAFLFSREQIYEVDPRAVWDLELDERGEQELDARLLLTGRELTEKELIKRIAELEEVLEDKMRKIKESTKEIIRKHYMKELEKSHRRELEYQTKLDEAPHYSKLLVRERKRRKRLMNELRSKLEELEDIFKIHSVHELIGIAIVRRAPKGGEETKELVDEAGMHAVLEYEMRRARTDEERRRIKDVSKLYKGYDVQSFDRVIEVKSFKETGPVRFTSHEWETAKRMKDMYWLYVVENALTNPKIYPIENPAQKFEKQVVKVPVIDYKYVIEDWKVVIKGGGFDELSSRQRS